MPHRWSSHACIQFNEANGFLDHNFYGCPKLTLLKAVGPLFPSKLCLCLRMNSLLLCRTSCLVIPVCFHLWKEKIWQKPLFLGCLGRVHNVKIQSIGCSLMNNELPLGCSLYCKQNAEQSTHAWNVIEAFGHTFERMVC